MVISKKQNISITNQKAKGRVYTPDYIVSNILDFTGYNGLNILERHIIDNSCGDGAFLIEIVKRYCEIARSINKPVDQIKMDLEQYIHGIEIDEEECEKCRQKVSITVKGFGITDIDWDINCGDAMINSDYDGKMDYVVGNPPYVRVHNLLDTYETVKNFLFAQNGMTDLFIVFYEIGLKMLKQTGTLGYITPSSFYNSVAGRDMRKYFVSNRNIKIVVDMKHFQPFEATTYTTIIILSKERNDGVVEYFEYDVNNFIPVKISNLNYSDFYFEGDFYFGKKNDLSELRKIISFHNIFSDIEVKNGFATLCDDFFIGDLPFDEYTIKVLKASTKNWKKCLFPYDEYGKLIPYSILTQNPQIKLHYENNAERLNIRSLEKNAHWYGFGRSQGINDVFKNKYAINSLMRNIGDIKLCQCEPGTGVYSGLYILTKHTLDELKEILLTEDFITYVSMLSKYKSGGYYTFSSKNLQKYLEYKFSERNASKYEQLNFFENA